MTALNQFLVWMFGFSFFYSRGDEGLSIICLVFAIVIMGEFVIKSSLSSEGKNENHRS